MIRASVLRVGAGVLCLSCSAGADVPSEWASRIRDAYRVNGDLRFETRERVLSAAEADVRVVRVTSRAGVGVRTDDLSVLLRRTMSGMHGVIHREDGAFAILNPAPFNKPPKPAQLYRPDGGYSPSASVRVAPFQRGEWILEQFRGPEATVSNDGDRVTIRSPDGGAEVVLDAADLTFRAATLAKPVRMTIEVKELQPRSPMPARWPKQIIETVLPPGGAPAESVATELLYTPAEAAQLPRDEFDWWTYTPRAVDQATGQELAAGNTPTGVVTEPARRVKPAPLPEAPAPVKAPAANPETASFALPPPDSAGVPWLWALGLTSLTAACVLLLRRRMAS